MTVFRQREHGTSSQEGVAPIRKAPLIAFVMGVMTLVLLAGWLSRLA